MAEVKKSKEQVAAEELAEKDAKKIDDAKVKKDKDSVKANADDKKRQDEVNAAQEKAKKEAEEKSKKPAEEVKLYSEKELDAICKKHREWATKERIKVPEMILVTEDGQIFYKETYATAHAGAKNLRIFENVAKSK